MHVQHNYRLLAPARLWRHFQMRRSKHRGHPTLFNGVQYRSRLEARWGALFYILKWDFTYEPPLSLHYYIPDFILPGEGFLLAECKPFVRHDDPEVAKAQTKIKESGWEGHSALLGSAPYADKKGRTVFGLRTTQDNSDPHVMLPFHLVRVAGDWVTCTCENDHASTKTDTINQAWARYAWHDAGNRVQFKKPRGI